jgi:hypothetical protein
MVGMLISLFLLASASAQTVQDDIMQLKKDVAELKARVTACEKAGGGATGGLKTEDLKGKTAENASGATAAAGGQPQLSEQMRKELMENLQKIKKNQEQQQKVLEELDKQ